MGNKLLEIIDFEKVDTLLEGFNKSTGFVTAILDLEGNILSKSGWREICVMFHRVHPETAKKCTKSDTVLANNLANGNKYHFYKCMNGLIDVAVPIVIKGEHIANLFSGQFLFEEPDMHFFGTQAAKYKFDKQIYLKALAKVPVLEKDKVLTILDFLLNMTELIVEMSKQRLDQQEADEEIKELNRNLEERIIERTKELEDSQVALLNLVEDLNEKSEQLQQSTNLLQAKNKELETFTYSVSHDLKAPLRGIDGYSSLLEELYYDSFDEEGRHFLRTIRSSTKQMNQLIEDLLSYSRLERASIQENVFNIKQLALNISGILTTDIKTSKVNIVNRIPDYEICSDKNCLSIALRNLIENSMKFSAQTDNPTIEIDFREETEFVILSIKDNGIGFDMKFKNRIFEIFQRLNLPEQYNGTGIGLAMVKKAMDRIKGTVWAESSFGEGAIFYLKIPKLCSNAS